jgi:hypothetical protein
MSFCFSNLDLSALSATSLFSTNSMEKKPNTESWKNELDELIGRKKEENEILKKLKESMTTPVSEKLPEGKRKPGNRKNKPENQ